MTKYNFCHQWVVVAAGSMSRNYNTHVSKPPKAANVLSTAKFLIFGDASVAVPYRFGRKLSNAGTRRTRL